MVPSHLTDYATHVHAQAELQTVREDDVPAGPPTGKMMGQFPNQQAMP